MKNYTTAKKNTSTHAMQIVFIFATFLLTSGCYSTTYRFQKPDANQAAQAQADGTLNQTVSFANVGFGIYPITDPVRPLCNQGQTLKKINFGMNIADAIIHFFVGIGYTSRHVNVYCK